MVRLYRSSALDMYGQLMAQESRLFRNDGMDSSRHTSAEMRPRIRAWSCLDDGHIGPEGVHDGCYDSGDRSRKGRV
jgi:hypothetical protein